MKSRKSDESETFWDFLLVSSQIFPLLKKQSSIILIVQFLWDYLTKCKKDLLFFDDFIGLKEAYWLHEVYLLLI